VGVGVWVGSPGSNSATYALVVITLCARAQQNDKVVVDGGEIKDGAAPSNGVRDDRRTCAAQCAFAVELMAMAGTRVYRGCLMFVLCVPHCVLLSAAVLGVCRGLRRRRSQAQIRRADEAAKAAGVCTRVSNFLGWECMWWWWACVCGACARVCVCRVCLFCPCACAAASVLLLHLPVLRGRFVCSFSSRGIAKSAMSKRK